MNESILSINRVSKVRSDATEKVEELMTTIVQRIKSINISGSRVTKNPNRNELAEYMENEKIFILNIESKIRLLASVIIKSLYDAKPEFKDAFCQTRLSSIDLDKFIEKQAMKGNKHAIGYIMNKLKKKDVEILDLRKERDAVKKEKAKVSFKNTENMKLLLKVQNILQVTERDNKELAKEVESRAQQNTELGHLNTEFQNVIQKNKYRFQKLERDIKHVNSSFNDVISTFFARLNDKGAQIYLFENFRKEVNRVNTILSPYQSDTDRMMLKNNVPQELSNLFIGSISNSNSPTKIKKRRDNTDINLDDKLEVSQNSQSKIQLNSRSSSKTKNIKHKVSSKRSHISTVQNLTQREPSGSRSKQKNNAVGRDNMKSLRVKIPNEKSQKYGIDLQNLGGIEESESAAIPRKNMPKGKKRNSFITHKSTSQNLGSNKNKSRQSRKMSVIDLKSGKSKHSKDSNLLNDETQRKAQKPRNSVIISVEDSLSLDDTNDEEEEEDSISIENMNKLIQDDIKLKRNDDQRKYSDPSISSSNITLKKYNKEKKEEIDRQSDIKSTQNLKMSMKALYKDVKSKPKLKENLTEVLNIVQNRNDNNKQSLIIDMNDLEYNVIDNKSEKNNQNLKKNLISVIPNKTVNPRNEQGNVKLEKMSKKNIESVNQMKSTFDFKNEEIYFISNLRITNSLNKLIELTDFGQRVDILIERLKQKPTRTPSTTIYPPYDSNRLNNNDSNSYLCQQRKLHSILQNTPNRTTDNFRSSNNRIKNQSYLISSKDYFNKGSNSVRKINFDAANIQKNYNSRLQSPSKSKLSNNNDDLTCR